ncbi:RNase adapter RapZ [Pararhodobacter marinus]|uniref:RNase adapter RapZ n=1 Tax=Pararhodobacter marinus TaxID=2184063 RepID=A0A2U2C452_9RHOB|nr:RNase adapter RapZ [Pararhodobacter marinus]PWE26584.1 RNase adapter RapZ [Pararhodobacter marinus]
MQDTANPIRVVMVTGPSGAGRSSAINALEDLGFEAIDNLPMSLIPRLLDGPPLPRPLALGVDVRNRDFSSESLIELVDRLHRLPNAAVELLYLDCDTDTLVRRYSETRRRHPLSPDDAPLIGIEYELALLEPVRARADVLIETTGLTPHHLRAEISRWFAPRDGRPMALSIQSFSYKRGLPRGVDMVFDVRFLTNPHWVPELREHDGRNPQVAAHIEADPRFADFFTRVHDLIASLLEAYVDEGKASLTIAFGCSGGKHRSVALAEKMARVLADQGWRVSKRHRELERRKLMAASEKQG